MVKSGSIAQIVQLCAITEIEVSQEQIPSTVHGVIQEFQNCFQEPTGLPPQRVFDHGIPLVPNAQPVNTKPYIYAPQ